MNYKTENEIAVQNLGARLRQLREQAGLTLKQVAEQIDISASYLGEIERGAKDNPTLKEIVSLANFYEVQIGYLFWYGY